LTQPARSPASVGRRRSSGGAIGIEFHSAPLFWAGILLTATGVLLHLPDFLGARAMGYRMAGMEMSWSMHLGMALILSGMPIAGWGLLPRGGAAEPRSRRSWRFHALDDAPLSAAHWTLLFTLGVALVIDVMKPATLGFVMPGTKAEYGLTSGQVALLPLFALTGTTIGSLGWGMLADRMGRRASILLASILFIGTSICGFMPSFRWNLFMCFVMGLSAGGMLPVVYALMTESVPASKRGWMVVLFGGLGTIGGYMAASGLAALFEPVFTWRILWFAGLPTGLGLVALNRFIPESPRFLMEHGRVREARAVMERYGVVMDDASDPAVEPEPLSPEPRLEGIGRLFRQPFLPRTLMLALYGLGWGIVNWGFLTFLPTFLRDGGVEGSRVSELLFLSAVIAVPGAVLVAWLYGMWSSKKSLILYAGITAAAVAGFAFLDPDPAAAQGTLLVVLVVVLLVASSGAISMLSPYAAEVFPTHLRGSGSGLAAASSKLGGIVGPPIVAAVATLSPGLAVPAFVTAVPVAVAAVVLSLSGVETRGRRLEELDDPEALAAVGGTVEVP